MNNPIKVQPDENATSDPGFFARMAAMFKRSRRIDSPDYKMRHYSKNRVGTHSRNKMVSIAEIRARNKRERQSRVHNRNARVAHGLRA